MADNKATMGKASTKSEVYTALATTLNVSRKQVSGFFEELGKLIKRDLGKKGPGVFTVPGLLKLKRISKPATKARKGINPFTKEEQVFKAKPARMVVKAQPLKALKEMVK